MASKSTGKKGKRAHVTDTGEEFEAVEASPQKKLCTICGGAPAKIEKNGNYDAMMQLYWCTLGIDVKPDICNKTDACKKCFDKVVKYFETNDIIVYFENYFKSLRSELLRKTLKGMTVWDKEGAPLNSIQKQVRQKYGTSADYKEPDESQMRIVKSTLKGYKVDCFEILNDDDEQGTSRKGMKLAKVNETTEGSKKGKISLKMNSGRSAITDGNSDTDDSDS